MKIGIEVNLVQLVHHLAQVGAALPSAYGTNYLTV